MNDEKTANAGNEKKEKSKQREIIETILYFAGVIVVCLLIVKFVAYRCIVVGSSMETTLQDGNNLIVEKVSYYFSDPKRFDVVILDRKDITFWGQEKNSFLIKRVIGLPGETIYAENGKVFINGAVLETDIYPAANYTAAMGPITLRDDEYFVMGDNRDHSSDSRVFGPISKKDIDGRAWVRFWPLNKIGTVGGIK